MSFNTELSQVAEWASENSGINSEQHDEGKNKHDQRQYSTVSLPYLSPVSARLTAITS